MRVLITGGAGFIGRHVCKVHLDQGDEVFCFDNLFTSKRSNIEEFFPHPRFEFIRGDVCDPFHLEADAIYHLACPAAPIHYTRNAARTIETAFLGTLNALRLARETGARILIASTSEVYGDPLQHPQREDYRGNVNPVGPRSQYDEGKRAAEALAVTYARQYGVQVRIARIFNTYGPFMASGDGRIVPMIFDAIRDGKPITIFGSGDQTRSFCFVDDTVEGLRRLLMMPPILNSANGAVLPPVVNIGNPTEVTMKELVRLAMKAARVAASDYSITFSRNPVGDDPARRCPDISLAKRLLGWEPGVDLAEGLRRIIIG
jgi:UDP-glucuronate decarboxylase